jgi:hypothetical protein
MEARGMLPVTLNDYLERVARETAKMSWPGQMSPILHASTKGAVEGYFATSFLSEIQNLWDKPAAISDQAAFDDWHRRQVYRLGDFLQQGNHIKHERDGMPTDYISMAIACKLLNTFMHQLMKYQGFRALWKYLHLVLDDVAFSRLSSLRYKSLSSVREILKNDNPYKIPYEKYALVQQQLLELVLEFNQQPNAQYRITSRIELNAALWA